MKAVVLEIKDKWAAVLCEDGIVRKTKKGRLKVGDSLDYKSENQGKIISLGSFRRNLAGSAAALFLLTVGAVGTYSYNNVLACSYVSLDINPSIEYTLNRQNKVINVKGLNEEGQEIADELLLSKKMTLEEALEETKQLLTKKSYLSSNLKEDLLVNVSSNNAVRMDALQKEILSVFDTDHEQGELNLVLTESDLKEHKEARDLGISTGTYKQIQYIKTKSETEVYSLQASDIANYKGYTVSELLESSGQEKVNSVNESSNNKAESAAQKSNIASQEGQSAEKKGEQPDENNKIKDESTKERTELQKNENESKAVEETPKNSSAEQTLEEAWDSHSEQSIKQDTESKKNDTNENNIEVSPDESRETKHIEPQQNNKGLQDNRIHNEGANQGNNGNR